MHEIGAKIRICINIISSLIRLHILQLRQNLQTLLLRVFDLLLK